VSDKKADDPKPTQTVVIRPATAAQRAAWRAEEVAEREGEQNSLIKEFLDAGQLYYPPWDATVEKPVPTAREVAQNKLVSDVLNPFATAEPTKEGK